MRDLESRRGCGPMGRLLVLTIVLVALFGVGLAIYLQTDGEGQGTLTPAGANYNPGSSGAVTKPIAPKR